jgi:hypothetical protein
LRSRSCGDGAHRECGHLAVTVVPDTARHRRHPPVVLCGCACHSACPLVNRELVAVAVWEQRCTCPGTGEARRRIAAAGQPAGDFTQLRARLRRERRQQRAARGEAFDAARGAAAGKTRAEIRAHYEAELRTRGLPVPPSEVLDTYAAAIAGDPSLTPMSLAGRTLTETAKELDKLRIILKNIRIVHDDN